MKRPAFQFYPADWRKDPALSICSLSARGLWIEMMCIAHESEEYGVLIVAGKPMTAQHIARSVGESVPVVNRLLSELEEAGVFSRDDRGCIFSRRMRKDEHIRDVRAAAGRLGGNPNLLKQEDKHLVKQTDKQSPTPSSSSSNTEKTLPPQPPRAGGAEPSSALPSNKRERKPRISLKTFLDRCQQAGEKAVSAYAPLLEYVEATGLPMEFVQLAWDHFKREHLPPGANQARLQADWRRHFLAYVEKGYYRLWYAKPDGGYELTTVGIQAQRLHAAGGEHAA
ncbi:MAG: hypothetical protein GY844_06080 [Bradyrhizobium sp.]|nr:hypothetical protein [Bradyrhizobium sp.]